MKTAIPERSRSGSTLVVVLGVLTVILTLVGVSYNMTSHVARVSVRSRSLQDATTIGLGALDVAFSGWRAVGRNNGTYAVGLPTASFATLPVPPTALFSSDPAVTLSNFRVQAVDPQITVDASETSLLPVNSPPPRATGVSAAETSYYYLASVDVSVPGLNGSINAKVRRIFEKQNVSPWKYAIFYNDDLEIHPGPSFTLTGMVHTNGSLYTGHTSLHFASKVSYGNQWKIGFMPGDQQHLEVPTSPIWPANMPPASESNHQPFGVDTAKNFNTTDSNPNNDDWRSLIQPPVAGFPDPIATQRYYNQAGIKVTVDAANTVTILNASGTPVTAASTGSDQAVYNTMTAALQTGQAIQDNREGATMRVVSLDVGVITAAAQNVSGTGNTLPGFNGIIYIHDSSGKADGIHPAVRLLNGASLPPGGLTVASENPVYIQGDYNTGTTSAASPPSNSAADENNPTVPGYTRQPASVLADAVTILSNAWADVNSSASLSSRIGVNTTINAAILGGNVPTGSNGGNYSGGAENLPRFLEDWSAATFTYYGSMVELFPSAQATGIWGNGNVYSPPTRRWHFDTGFLSNPPPGSFVTTNYNKQRWYLK